MTTFTINGRSQDYGWGLTEDGQGIVVWKGSWFEVLSKGTDLCFSDKTVDTSPLFGGSTGGSTNGSNGGSTSGNAFTIAGNSADYGWGLTEDGQGIVVWKGSWFEVVSKGTDLKFADKTVDTDYLFGGSSDGSTDGSNGGGSTSGNSFAINGKSSDYGWGLTEDGKAMVVWKGSWFEILAKGTNLCFSDKVVDTDYLFDGSNGGGGSEGPVNRDPDARDDAASTGAGVKVTGNVLSNDTDADGDKLTVSLENGPKNGTLTLNPDGTFSYQPNSGFTGTDTFTYAAQDGKGGCDSATVTITVTPKPDPEPENTASIGDRVWLDANKNGLQDTGEAGVSGVTVQLKDASGNVIATQQTDANGNYLFDKLAAGNYQVGVTAPSQYEITAKDALGNGADGVDSDINVDNGHTDTIALKDGEAIRTVDAGLVEKVYNDGCIEGNLFAGQYKGEIARYPGAAEVIKNATINLLDGSGKVVATTKADATGFYEFEGLGSGNYKVQIVSTSLELAMVNTSLAGIDVHWMTDLRSNLALNEAGIYGDRAESLDSDVANVLKTTDTVMMRGNKVIVTTQEVHISGEACCVTIDAGFKTNVNNGSPIVLDLNHDDVIGVTGETTSQDKSDISSIGKTVKFDLDADGDVETIEWIDGKGDGLLVDVTKIGPNGEIDGKALFGDEGGKYANGYDKLALHDANGDGTISGDELASLGVWKDDGDAVLEDGELVSAADAGVTSVSAKMGLAYDDQGRALMQSTAEVDGETILTEDVWFASTGDAAQDDASNPASDMAALADDALLHQQSNELQHACC